MRISDWSSDVCSSDLPGAERGVHQPAVHGAVVQRRRIGGDGVDALDQIGLVHGLLGSPVALHPRLLCVRGAQRRRSEEHTSELQSLMRISYAVFCLKKKNNHGAKRTLQNKEQHTT